MIARLKAWLRRQLWEVPPEVVRPLVIDKTEFDAAVRRRKRRLLSEANRRGDEETVKRLTKELANR